MVEGLISEEVKEAVKCMQVKYSLNREERKSAEEKVRKGNINHLSNLISWSL